MSAAGGDFYAAGCVVRRQFIGKISARPQSGRERRKRERAREARGSWENEREGTKQQYRRRLTSVFSNALSGLLALICWSSDICVVPFTCLVEPGDLHLCPSTSRGVGQHVAKRYLKWQDMASPECSICLDTEIRRVTINVIDQMQSARAG